MLRKRSYKSLPLQRVVLWKLGGGGGTDGHRANELILPQNPAGGPPALMKLFCNLILKGF